MENLDLTKTCTRQNRLLEEKENHLNEINQKTEELRMMHPNRMIDSEKLAIQIQEVFQIYFPEPVNTKYFEFTLDIQFMKEQTTIIVDSSMKTFDDMLDLVGRYYSLIPELIYFQDYHHNLFLHDMDIRESLFNNYFEYFMEFVPKVYIVLINNLTFDEIIQSGQKEGFIDISSMRFENAKKDLLFEELELLEHGRDLQINSSSVRRIFISPSRKGKSKAVIVNEDDTNTQNNKPINSNENCRNKVRWLFRFLINCLFFFLFYMFQINERPQNLMLSLQ